VPYALVEVDMADATACIDQAVRVIDSLGNAEAFFAVGQPFGEGAHLGETPGQHVTRQHGGQPREAEVLSEPCPKHQA
jgi:hypothetical protein